MNSQKTPKIRVLIRKRPMSKKQLHKGELDIVQVQNGKTILVREQKVKVDLTPYTDEYRFNFDGAYDQTSTNQQIYQTSIKPLVQCAFDGARVSCFAYGQTGSGKTYTMLGDGKEVYGLYLLAACDIFEQIVQKNGLQVWVSFYEIYCGKLFDLLNNRNVLVAREDAKNKVNIVGLSQRKVTNVQNLMQTIQFGSNSRVTAQNGTNVESSRSHAILQIAIKNGKKVHGKISFIDLAGSERAADHADQLQKQTRIDGAQINKSLLALKECIRALDQNKVHTSFRGSKLTMVLKDSFTGYCKSVMIGNISPNSSSSQNTLNTLKYADRVKQLKKPRDDQNEQNFDGLNKQLMLPRQMVNYRRYESNQQKKQQRRSVNKSAVNQISNHQRDITPKNRNRLDYYQNNKSGYEQRNKPQGTKSDSKARNNIYQEQQTKKKSRNQKQNNYLAVQQTKKRPNTTYNITPRRDISDKGSQYKQYGSFEQLHNKHQKFVQSILQQEQLLLKEHESHVNSSISMVKKQMQLLRTTGDPDSNMQEYLYNYDSLLEKQLQSLLSVRNKVHNLIKHYKSFEKVEKKYLQESNKFYVQEDDSLLENEDNLFRN